MQINAVENSTLARHDIEYFFKENLKIFSCVGFKCSFTKKSETFKFYHRIPTYIANIFGLTVFALQIYFIIDKIQINTLIAIQSLSYAVINVQSIFKGFMMANAINNVQRLLESLGAYWNKHKPNESDRDLIFDRVYKTLTVCHFYFFMALCLCFTYIVQCLISFYIQYRNLEATNHTYDFSNRVLLLKYPFDIHTVANHFLIVFVEVNYVFICVTYWCNCDTLFVAFLSHVYVQFKALKYDTTSAFNSNTLKERFILIDMVNRHRELLRICYLIEEIYSPIIFSSTLLSAVNICVTVYGVRESMAKGYYIETGISMFLVIGTTLQIILYCVFAESLTEETRSLADSMYNLKWTTKDNTIKFYIQLIIMRCQKPFYCTAYGFFPIGHQQLTSIISTAFSYYMMLQTMSN